MSLITRDCYFANGTLVPPNTIGMLPCENNPVRTICCTLDRQNPPGEDVVHGLTRDECLPNGLCQNRWTEVDEPKVAYWLTFCTDSNVASGNCLDICKDHRNTRGSTEMTPCDGTNTSERWCCGDSDACCTNNSSVQVLPNNFSVRAIPGLATATSSGSTSMQPTSLQSLPTSSQNSPANVKPSGLSTGAKAGVGIVIALIVVSIIGMIFFVRKAMVWKYAARGQQLQGSRNTKPSYTLDDLDKRFRYPGAGYPPSEMSHHRDPAELLATSAPIELPARVQQVE